MQKKQILIAPSFLSANFLNLQSDIEMINKSEADWFHLDIMDGSFVPNISFGFPIIKQINQLSQKPLDVHLMIIEPDKYIKKFKEVGTNILTVHYEACNHLHRTIQNIKQEGMKAGVAINPHTPVDLLIDIIQDIDVVLIMSVNPGFGGQKFIENTYSKIKRLKQIIAEKEANTLIEIDGGVNLQNSKKLIEAGANVLIAGSSVFKSNNPVETIRKLKIKN